MRRTAMVLTLAVAVALPAGPAGAATRDVAVNASSFSPNVVTAPAGDVVRWQKSGGFHNVASTQGMFRSGDATFDAFTYTRTFSAGTFSYMCEIHGDTGMTGKVRIRPRISAAPTGRPFTVRWANTNTNTGSSFRVQYRVGSGDWKTWRSSTSTFSGVFGAEGKPIAVQSGRTYGFRARSIRGENVSGYSPIAAFTP